MAKSAKKAVKGGKGGKGATEAEARAQSIEEMTAAFLESGGKIQEIPNGVSGQTSLSGPKHITIEKKQAPSIVSPK